jgi:hypothetical protein
MPTPPQPSNLPIIIEWIANVIVRIKIDKKTYVFGEGIKQEVPRITAYLQDAIDRKWAKIYNPVPLREPKPSLKKEKEE